MTTPTCRWCQRSMTPGRATGHVCATCDGRNPR